jgi:sugar/nucleoside kinase (ribokinase family)
MHIVTVGDVVLDILVNAPRGLRTDDDTEARIALAAGGQAANVATWSAALGARATVIGPKGQDIAAGYIESGLARRGVDMIPIDVSATGKVVAIVTGRERTLASDAGDQSWAARLDPNLVDGQVDWLHVSGYPLLRADNPEAIVAFVDAVRRQGVPVSVDLSSAGLIAAYGSGRFAELVRTMSPRLVFANESEWTALGLDASAVDFDLVIKRGAAGVTTVIEGRATDHDAPPVDVVDLTGAGDALAAGHLVGGIDLGLATAARCVAQLGAQPTLAE